MCTLHIYVIPAYILVYLYNCVCIFPYSRKNSFMLVHLTWVIMLYNMAILYLRWITVQTLALKAKTTTATKPPTNLMRKWYEIKQAPFTKSYLPSRWSKVSTHFGEWSLLFLFWMDVLSPIPQEGSKGKWLPNTRQKHSRTFKHLSFLLCLIRHWKYHCVGTKRACWKPPDERKRYIYF